MDAAAVGAFLSLTIPATTALVEKMSSNQVWNEECVQPHKRGGGMHQLKEVDMLSAKMDLLMKKLEDRANEKQEVMHIYDSRMTCEVYGNTEHLGNNCPKTHEDVNFVNNNNYFHPQQNQGWNQQQRPNYQGNYQGNNFKNFKQQPLRELIAGQSKLMEGLSRKVATNDKILENINNRMDSFASTMKKQHSFNKMVESQIAQLAAIVPPSDKGKILGQPEDLETTNLIDIHNATYYYTEPSMGRWIDYIPCLKRKVFQKDLSSPSPLDRTFSRKLSVTS